MSHLELHSVFQAYLRVTPMQWIRRERAIRLIEIPDELHRNPDS